MTTTGQPERERDDHLRRYARRLTGSHDEADDLVQQTIARLTERAADRLDHEGYARRTLVRLWLDRQRSLARRFARLSRLAFTTPSITHDASPDEAETRDAVRAAVDRLPPRQRAVLVLRVVEGLSYDEIASALECSPESVRMSLSLARRRCRQLLAEDTP